MRSRTGLLKGGESGEASINLGQPNESPLILAIEWADLEMPPKENDRLSAEQINFVRDWVAGGAPWPIEWREKEILSATSEKWRVKGVVVKTSGGLSDDWSNRKYDPADLWAYQPLWRDESEGLKSTNRNPIDILIDKRLVSARVQQSKRADKLTLIRRLSFDLTGLPPTPSEVDSFAIKDDTPKVFNQEIERLLASPRYGERWAQHWLDVVRYADSSGFSNDFLRANAWRYRDYVVRSFNDDKPYDQFVSEQIAGDEINPGDPDSLIAVGFLRMGPWEHTSMTVAAVTRQHFLDDVTNNVGVAFLAHELRCASCHDHKFDPIPTQDYYRMQAVFAPTQFVDRKVEFLPTENINGIKNGKERFESLLESPGPQSLSTIPEAQRPVKDWDAETETLGHAKVARKRTQLLTRELKRFEPFAFSVYSGPLRPFVSTKPYSKMPKAKLMKGAAQVVRILTGGSIESPSDVVSAGVLSAVGSTGSESTIPQSTTGRRAALAKWLTSKEHPLTARVIANRVWLYHFGKGLAGNPNNFGVTGKKPTHPELLDFLAGYLIEHDWSIKDLHRLILTSEAWQRSVGPVSEKTKQADPDNLLYSHFSPRRLSAEELRDSMLVVSGELNYEMGGIPARPNINLEVAMQPRHIMGSVAPAYQPSPTPAQRNRRTIYAERIRTLRDPMLEVFNQPGLDTSCETRDASTITPQAFTLLNSQNSFDRSLAWANRLTRKHDVLNDRISAAFNESLGRLPNDSEIEKCQSHYKQALEYHRSNPIKQTEPPKFVVREMVEEMTGLNFYWVESLDIYASEYEDDLKPTDVSPETQALADVCLVLFNSNEFIYVY